MDSVKWGQQIGGTAIPLVELGRIRIRLPTRVIWLNVHRWNIWNETFVYLKRPQGIIQVYLFSKFFSKQDPGIFVPGGTLVLSGCCFPIEPPARLDSGPGSTTLRPPRASPMNAARGREPNVEHMRGASLELAQWNEPLKTPKARSAWSTQCLEVTIFVRNVP